MPAEAAYCPACGQSAREISRPWLEMARELAIEIMDVDGRMFRSLSLLLTRPGFLSQEYMRGRRVMYTSPIRMYLVISLLFFLVLPLILPPPEGVSPGHKLSVDLYSKGMFVLLPVFAVMLKLFYRRYFYIDHLVFSVHLFSVSYIAFALLLSIESLADRYLVVGMVQVVLLLATIGYAVISLHRMFGDSWTSSTVKVFARLLLFLTLLCMLIE